ncbi:MAG: hypothetical protein IKJ81_05640 [Bacteroidales bacterium]|nr:hypothetical protein [Bacteroidales bacterium]
MKTQKEIEQIVDNLNAKALSDSLLLPDLAQMLDGVERRCDKEMLHHKRLTTIRRCTLNTISCIIIILFTYCFFPNNQYAYVFDGNLVNHSETVNKIDKLFAL